MDNHLTNETSIEALELSARVTNVLRAGEITTIGDLTSRTEEEIMRVYAFGRKHLREVKETLAKHGFVFHVETAEEIRARGGE